MKNGMLLSIVLLGTLAIMFSGCSNSSNSTDGTGDSTATSVKTMDEYREEAAQTITSENAEDELEKLEQEINADN